MCNNLQDARFAINSLTSTGENLKKDILDVLKNSSASVGCVSASVTHLIYFITYQSSYTANPEKRFTRRSTHIQSCCCPAGNAVFLTGAAFSGYKFC